MLKNSAMMIVGNWKMNGTYSQSRDLLAAILPAVEENRQKQVVICPPFTLLFPMLNEFGDRNLKFGAQNCHYLEKGAYTGEISAQMLAEQGVTYVILGHSERREHFNESSSLVQQKAIAAKAVGVIPIICIGETLEQREAGREKDILAQQIRESIPANFLAEDFVLAYEPVWAIGTGKVASAKMIAEMHQYLISLLPARSKLLYGGSVNAENAEEILQLPHVDGVLVGGASLKAESFNAIIQAVKEAA